MEQFYKIASEVHKQRVRDRHSEYSKKEKNGVFIYHSFSLWCDSFEPRKDKENPKQFAEYLRNKNIVLTKRQREYIAEKYFGYLIVKKQSEDEL